MYYLMYMPKSYTVTITTTLDSGHTCVGVASDYGSALNMKKRLDDAIVDVGFKSDPYSTNILTADADKINAWVSRMHERCKRMYPEVFL
jgi:hypothetical protein